MRKNQAAQSIALAFGLVGGLGFLGYTMLGDMLEDDPGRVERTVPAPVLKQHPAVALSHIAPKPAPATVVPAESASLTPQPTALPVSPVNPDAATVQSAANSASVGTLAPTAQPEPVKAQSQFAVPAATVPAAAMPRVAPAAVLVPPPAPVPTRVAAMPLPQAATEEAAEVAPTTKHGRRRRRHAREEAAVEPAPPAAVKPAPVRIAEQSPAPKAAPAQPAPIAQPLATPVTAAVAPAKAAFPDAVRKQAPATPASTMYTSKDDMSVVVSGQKAWVRVSPTRTMEAKKGDVLPNLGKILEIRGDQVVAEKGTLTTN